MGSPSKKGTDKDDDGLDVGHGGEEKCGEKFEDLDGVHGKGIKDDDKNVGDKGSNANTETIAQGEGDDCVHNVNSGEIRGGPLEVVVWNLVATRVLAIIAPWGMVRLWLEARPVGLASARRMRFPLLRAVARGNVSVAVGMGVGILLLLLAPGQSSSRTKQEEGLHSAVFL